MIKIILALVMHSMSIFTQIPEKKSGYMHDYASVCDSTETQQLEKKLMIFKQTTNNRLFVTISLLVLMFILTYLLFNIRTIRYKYRRRKQNKDSIKELQETIDGFVLKYYDLVGTSFKPKWAQRRYQKLMSIVEQKVFNLVDDLRELKNQVRDFGTFDMLRIDISTKCEDLSCCLNEIEEISQEVLDYDKQACLLLDGLSRDLQRYLMVIKEMENEYDFIPSSLILTV